MSAAVRAAPHPGGGPGPRRVHARAASRRPHGLLLFGLQDTRLLGLTLHDIIDNDTVVALSLNGHRLPLPPEVAQLVRALRDQRRKSWHLDQTASTTPWLFPGQEPARPLGATYLYL